MTTVSQRIFKRLGENEATPFKICDIVVAPLLGVLQEAMVSTNLGEDVTAEDIHEFLRCIIILSFDSETPSKFFNPTYRECYPIAEDRSSRQFQKCLNALKHRT
jgi:hypothetical protein